MFGSHCDNNCFHCTIGSVMHLLNRFTYKYKIVMSCEIENKQMIYVAKSFSYLNGIEMKYNCAKRYHILWTNCAKGIIFGL